MSLIASLAVATFFAQAAPTAAGTPVAEPTPAVAAAPPIKGRVRKDGKICRAEPVLGSRMPVTLCATAQEWEARRTSDKEALDKIQHAVRNPNT